MPPSSRHTNAPIPAGGCSLSSQQGDRQLPNWPPQPTAEGTGGSGAALMEAVGGIRSEDVGFPSAMHHAGTLGGDADEAPTGQALCCLRRRQEQPTLWVRRGLNEHLVSIHVHSPPTGRSSACGVCLVDGPTGEPGELRIPTSCMTNRFSSLFSWLLVTVHALARHPSDQRRGPRRRGRRIWHRTEETRRASTASLFSLGGQRGSIAQAAPILSCRTRL